MNIYMKRRNHFFLSEKYNFLGKLYSPALFVSRAGFYLFWNAYLF